MSLDPKMREEVKKKVLDESVFGPMVDDLFNSSDTDKSGFIDRAELKKLLAELGQILEIPPPSDNDVENELRICEELYYHCQNDSRYIGELHNALREIGIDPDKTVTKHYILKDEFKQTEKMLYDYKYIELHIMKENGRDRILLLSLEK